MSSAADRGASALSIGGRRGGLLIGAVAALSALFSLGSQILFERALGVQGFAEWAYAGALITIFVPIACLGSGHLLLSPAPEGAAGDGQDAWLHALYFGAFAALSLAALSVTLLAGRPGVLATLPGALVVSVFLVQVPIVLVFPVFQLRNQVAWVAGWPLLQVSLRLAIALAALLAGLAVLDAMLAWLLASACLAAVAARQAWPSLRARLRQPATPVRRRLPSREHAASFFQSGVGFGLSDLLDSLDLKLLVPLAAFLFGVTETAAAGLATVLLSAVHFFPNVLVMRILLPAVHRGTAETSRDLKFLVLKLSAISALVLVPCALAFLWIGFPVLAMLVRGDYASQAQALSYLGICFVPLCISQVAAAPHMARRTTWRLFRWRTEALLMFILTSIALQESGLLAVVIGFASGRAWLCVRVLWALRSTPG